MSTTTTTTSNHHNTKQKKPKGPVLLDVARGQMYSIVHKSAESLGWKLVVSDEAEAEREEESNAEPGGAPKSRGALPSAAASFPVSSDWNVAWHDQSISCKFLCGLQPHQHINHFPGIIELNRKVRMARRLRKMKELFPAAFCFAPDSWCLPMEESALRQVVQEEQAARSRLMSSADGNELKEGVPRESVFIVKPDKGSQAKGIFLYSASNELPNSFAASNEEVVVQRYINNPLLIEGYKFDLRLYVAITSVDPLRVYLFNDGLVRMCTQPYESAASTNVSTISMHLTNYTANKKSAVFCQRKDVEEDGFGFKRSVRWLRKWLAQSSLKVDVDRLWFEIGQVCTRTILVNRLHMANEYKACLPDDQYHDRCFELLGIDILITDDLRPVLMEVNHSPSLATDTPLDTRIKGAAVTDCLKMLGVRSNEAALAKKARLAASRKRRQQQIAMATQMRDMGQEDKAALKLQQRAEKAKSIAKRIDLIAERELANRGGFERIAPFDFSTGYLAALAPDQQARLQAEFESFSEAADTECAR